MSHCIQSPFFTVKSDFIVFIGIIANYLGIIDIDSCVESIDIYRS